MASVDLGVVSGKRQRKTVYAATRKEAAIKLQTALTAKASNSLVVGSVTMETWLTYWLDVICPERGLKVNTLKSHRSKVNQYLIPHLGQIRVDRLEPRHIRTMYAAMREKGLSPATLSQTHAVLRRALEVAVRERKAVYNPAAQMDRPQQPKVKREGLSLADARKVLSAAGDDPRWFLALYLGLRQGEALALRWSDVDLAEGVLHIERSLSVSNGQLVFDTPKTGRSTATLPLPTVVRSRLAVKWAQHLASGGTVDDLVFSRNGNPLHPRADWQAWKNLLNLAGVQHVPLHAARNTAATLLRSAGVQQQDVRAILRHTTVTMTEHYQADDLSRKREALAALEATLSGE